MAAENSLMFGLPKDPKSKTNEKDNKEEKLDFTNKSDRTYNYQNQIEYAQELMKLTELMGPKVSTWIASTLKNQMSDEKKAQFVHTIIKNDGDLQQLDLVVQSCIKGLDI